MGPRITITKVGRGRWCWEYEVYHSGYGLTYGRARSKKKARRKAMLAWAEMTTT